MVKICNIYPVFNQELYEGESHIMILAHLVKDGLYNPKYFNNHNAYVIMDNGLYEGAQVSTSLQSCIDIAEKSGIHVNEFVVPDAINDPDTTIKLFEENLETIKSHPQYNFMFVAHGKNEEEVGRMIDYINQYKTKGINNIVVGISKLSPMDRASDKAIDVYKKCMYDIHFLGLKESFGELAKVKDIIRSCDSSQLAYIVKNESPITSINPNTYKRVKDSNHHEIDLAKDALDSNSLSLLKNAVAL